MKYIEDAYIKVLKSSAKLHRGAAEVFQLLDRFRKTLNTEFQYAGNNEIHIIGSSHHSHDGLGEIAPVIESQREVYKTLIEINPDILGVEGFYREAYTRHAEVAQLQAEGVLPRRLTEKQIDECIKNADDHPVAPAIYKYYNENPSKKYTGVEHEALHQFQEQCYQSYEQLRRFGLITKESPIAILQCGTLRLRGLMMIAILTRVMRKTNSVRAALPVGALHLQEIKELKVHLNAKCWKTYNVSKLKDEDLRY